MTARRVLFWTHLAAGSLAGIVILIMSVTGVLLAYERQITNWANRDYRSAPGAASQARLSMDELLGERPRERTCGAFGHCGSFRSGSSGAVELWT